ncbi:hypothetical protein HDV02_000466 [Globomyces sp. JEL0801]|nr:hypothetical protein HDV02_000466 [Globomyces sp. JEL0801]
MNWNVNQDHNAPKDSYQGQYGSVVGTPESYMTQTSIYTLTTVATSTVTVNRPAFTPTYPRPYTPVPASPTQTPSQSDTLNNGLYSLQVPIVLLAIAICILSLYTVFYCLSYWKCFGRTTVKNVGYMEEQKQGLMYSQQQLSQSDSSLETEDSISPSDSVSVRHAKLSQFPATSYTFYSANNQYNDQYKTPLIVVSSKELP